MIADDPHGLFLQAGRRLTEACEALSSRVQDGTPPTPAETRSLLRAAREHADEVAVFLGPEPDPDRDPLGVACLEQAAGLCRRTAGLSLELARRHGPAYLVLPGE